MERGLEDIDLPLYNTWLAVLGVDAAKVEKCARIIVVASKRDERELLRELIDEIERRLGEP